MHAWLGLRHLSLLLPSLGPQTQGTVPSLSDWLFPRQLRQTRKFPAETPTGQPDLGGLSLRLSSQAFPDYVELTVKSSLLHTWVPEVNLRS